MFLNPVGDWSDFTTICGDSKKITVTSQRISLEQFRIDQNDINILKVGQDGAIHNASGQSTRAVPRIEAHQILVGQVGGVIKFGMGIRRDKDILLAVSGMI